MTTDETNTLSVVIGSLASTSDEIEELGKKVGKLYTDHGFPIDMALNKLGLPKETSIAVLFHAQSWLVEHKRQSGASEASLNRERKANRMSMSRYINRGEAGID